LDEKGAQRAPFLLAPFFRLLGRAFTLGCIESPSFGTDFLEIPESQASVSGSFSNLGRTGRNSCEFPADCICPRRPISNPEIPNGDRAYPVRFIPGKNPLKFL
jgi:hypothetical protein